ncbi:hypothetical protein J6590_037299 [Homalodisca vitripennis]|nr:hypothetical protein J6590_037299 [Homalodisca vitripennis]
MLTDSLPPRNDLPPPYTRFYRSGEQLHKQRLIAKSRWTEPSSSSSDYHRQTPNCWSFLQGQSIIKDGPSRRLTPGQRDSEGADPSLVASGSPLQCCSETGHHSTKTISMDHESFAESITNGSLYKIAPKTTTRIQTTLFRKPIPR